MQKAQGTIEYLVIIAVIVVIGLVVVSLMSTMFDSQTIATTSNKLGAKIGSSGISITDSLINENGEGLISIKNNSGETLTITKISTPTKEIDYTDKPIVSGNTTTFSLDNLDFDCPCTGTQNVTCVFEIEFISENGLTKTASTTITNTCDTGEIIIDDDIIPPLSCPTYAGLLEFDGNKVICDCDDLQNVDLDPTANYLLASDLDCLETSTWNGNLGFDPLTLSGTFFGNNKTISYLTVNRPTENNIGLFSTLSGEVLNLIITDANIIGKDSTGGLIGHTTTTSTVTNASANAIVVGETYAGGLVGEQDGLIINSSSSGTVNGNSRVGGLIGYNYWSVNTSFSSANVTGNTLGGRTGGFIGYNVGGVWNSYATGSVTGNASVGGFIGHDYNYFGRGVNYSYSVGEITCDFSCGGFIGTTDSGPPSDVLNSYYDQETSTIGAINISVADRIGESKTTDEMMQQATFVDWDFDTIWQISEGTSYPTLRD